MDNNSTFKEYLTQRTLVEMNTFSKESFIIRLSITYKLKNTAVVDVDDNDDDDDKYVYDNGGCDCIDDDYDAGSVDDVNDYVADDDDNDGDDDGDGDVDDADDDYDDNDDENDGDTDDDYDNDDNNDDGDNGVGNCDAADAVSKNIINE
ncbi:hypothetical protein ACF0H5_023822 [Mactra antiquata]